MIVVTKRNARRTLLASTALIAAVAALPAQAQTQIAAPRDGGAISGSGSETVEDNTPAGGGIYVMSAAAPITFTDVTIANTTGAGPTVGQAANALGLVNVNPADQAIVLNGTNSFSTTRLGGTAFRAQSLSADTSVTMNGGSQSFIGTDGLHLRGNAVTVTNNGGTLIASASGQYGVYSRANSGASTLNLGTVDITATASGGTGVYAYGYTGASVTTSGGSITAETGIAAYTENLGTIVSGSTITGTGTTLSIGIAGYGQAATSRFEITSNGAISNVYTGIYLENQTGLAGNVIRANANITASGAAIDTGASSLTDIYVGAGATVQGTAVGISVSSAGTTYNSGTIRGGTGLRSNAFSSVENSGVIDGNLYAVYLMGGGGLTNNSGATINSAGIGISVAGSVGTIENRGTITAGNGAGILLNAGGTATNYATITAVGSNSTGLRGLGTAATLDNRGTITANIGIRTDAAGSTLNNSGTINATSFGIYADPGSVTVTNSGSVTGDTGATLNGGGSITNTGSLIGGSYGITSAGAATTVVNSGTISGGFNAISLSSFNDSVTLNAGSTTTGSVRMRLGDDTLTIMTGATFGALTGDGGTDTLVLDGSTTGTLDMANVSTFEILNKIGTGTWTLTGAATGPAMAITAGNGTPSGTLVFNGTGLIGGITVNGAIIRATSAGAFGTGTITTVDPTIQYGATGTYANAILLASANPLNDPTRLEADAGVVATLTGRITENGTPQFLVIGGQGTISLAYNGGNAYSGGTTIENGATLVVNMGALGSGAVTNNGTLVLENISAGVSNAIGGTGNLVKRGSDTATLVSTNSYTGTTTIEAGTLGVSAVNGISSSSAVTLSGATAILDMSNIGANGAVLNNLSGVAGSQVKLAGKSATLANSANTIFAGTLSSLTPQNPSTAVTKSGTGTLTLSGNNSGLQLGVQVAGGTLALSGAGALSNAAFVRVDSGSFDISGVSGAGTSIKDLFGLGGNVVLGDKTLSITAARVSNDYGDGSSYRESSYVGVISGTGGINLTGGILTLAGANTYTGDTVVAAGAQLRLGGAGSIASSNMAIDGYLTLIDSNKTIHGISGAGVVSMNGYTLTIADGGDFAGQFNSGSLSLTGGTLVLTGSNAITNITLNGGDLTLGDGGTTGDISGTAITLADGTYTINRSDTYNVGNLTGAGNFVKAGTGTTEIWHSTYTGTTTVAGGTLQLNYGDAIADTSDLTVMAGATARLFGGDFETIGSLSGAGTFDLASKGLSLTDGGNFSGALIDTTGNGELRIEGGTLTFTGTGTHLGNTFIDPGATLVLGDGGTSGTLLSMIYVNGTLIANHSDSLILNNVVGTGTLIQAGTGTTHLAGTIGFDGTADVRAGTLAVDFADALRFATSVSLSAGTVLDSTGIAAEARVANLSGVAGSTVRFGDGGMRVTTTGNTSFAGTIEDAHTGTPLNAPGFTHAGTGTLTLTGQSNLANAGISGGTLALAGTGTLGSATHLAMSGGTLDLSGVTGGSYTLADLFGTAGAVQLGATNLTIANADPALNGFGGTISGSGGLHLAAGTLQMAAGQAYTGGTLIDSGARLNLTGAGPLASTLVTVNGGLDLTGTTAQLAINALAGTGTVTLGSAGLAFSSPTSFGGMITGSGGVTIGSGTQLVSKDWTYTGTTTLVGTTNLTLGTGGTTGSVGGAIALGGGTLTANRSNALTIARLTGSGAFVQAGTGETVLAGSGAGFTGTVTIANGALTLGNFEALSQAASVSLTGADAVLNTGNSLELATVNNLSGVAGSTVNINRDILALNNSVATTFAGTLHSVPDPSPFYVQGIVKMGAETLTLTGQNTLVSAFIEDGTLAVSGAGAIGDTASVYLRGGALDLSGITSGATAFGTLSSDGNLLVNLGATTLTLNGNPYGGEFEGVIQGTGGLVVHGRQELSGANTYSGDTLIASGGRLSLYGEGSIANSAVIANGIFDLLDVWAPDADGDGIDEIPDVVIANLSGSGAVAMGGGTLRLGNNDQDAGFSGAITGAGRVWKDGAGTWTLSGTNDIGSLLLFDGTVALTGNASLGANAVVDTAFGTLDISGISAPSLSLVDISGWGGVQLGDKTLVITNGARSYGGVMEGTGGVRIAGGAGTFAGTQLYTGVTTIDSGATLYLVGFDGALTGAAQVEGTLDISLHAGPTFIGGLSGSGTVELGPDDRVLTVNGGGSFSGSIHGDAGMVFAGGSSTLSGTNDYAGTTTVESGATLALTGTGTIGAGALVANGGFDLSAAAGDLVLANLSGSGSVTLGGNTLTLGGDDQDSLFSGVIGGTGGLTKTGTGVLTLSGANSYSGLTLVDAGTLRLGASGVLADDSSLEVRGGATLDLNGFDETVASFTILGNLVGSGTLTAATYTFLGGTIDHNLGAGAVYQRSGTTLLNGTAAGSAVHVEGGTLALGANERLADTAVVTVLAGATLDLQGFNETVGSLALAGMLNGTGTLTADSYTLDSALVNANLGAGTLIQRSGLSLLNGTAATGIVNVTGGTLQLGASDRLADSAAVSVATGTTLDLQGFNDTVGTLALGGTLAGTGTLTAATYTLDSATVDANLGAGTLIQRSGTSFLNGTAATGTVNITGGTLQLGAGDRLADAAAVTVASGTTLDLQGFSDTIGTLALGGTLAGTGTLTATSYTLDGAAVNANLGAGTLIQHSGTSVLNGTAAAGTIGVDAGTLRLGAADRLADSAALTVATGATLDLQGFSDTVGSLALAGTLGGTGTLTAATYTLDSATVNANLGAGTLVQRSGVSLLNGTAATATVNVVGGTLQLGVADRLADAAAVTVASGATLALQGFNETVGTLALAGTLSGTGTLNANTYVLDSATVNANLGAGTLIQHSGVSLLNGTAGTQIVNIDAGTLRLGAANRLADTAAVTVASGTTLDLQGYSDTVASLALSGTLSGTGTLSAASYTLNGAAVNANLGGGTLVQAGGTSVLAGTATGTNASITGGTLRIGNGGTSGWLDGNIAVGGALVFDRSDAVTYAGALSGTGSVSQAQGSLTLSGNSAGFGGSLTASGTSLAVTGQLGNAASSLTVASGTLSGTGSIGGTVTLADGAHLAGTSGTTLSMGALTLASGSVIDVTLSQPSSSALFAVAGNLTLDGTLNVTTQPGYGAGIYRLFSYGGTLTDNGLALGTSSDGLFVQTATAGQVNLINSAGTTLAFWDGGAAAGHDNGQVEGGAGTWSLGTRNWTDANGSVNGAMAPVPSFAVFGGTGGTVTIDNGPGQVSATGMQFATAGYTLAGGALALSGTQAIFRVGDGTAAGANISATVAAALIGSAALVKTDLGTLTLTGANSYTGGTIVQAGTLVGNAGSIRGAVQNAGTVVFDQANDASFVGAISGAGGFVKTGAGALTLTGASSSNWRITGGSLVSTSALFTGNLDLGTGTSFVFDQAANGSYAGTLTGTGSVLFRGGGTVLLTGDSSGFLGATSVSGLLSVNGTLGGTVNVLAGGRLQGSGTIGGGSIAGTIAPGNSIGTLTVSGNLSFFSGSTYEVEANAAGQSDKIVVNGTASIASGTSVSVLAANGNYALNTSYTILTAAGGLSGTFSSVTSNLAFLTPTLAYSANAVTLNLKRNAIDFAAVAQTSNQRGIGPAIEALGTGNGVYDAVVVLTAAEARAAFDQLSGSDYASMRGRLIDDSRFVRDAVLARGSLAGEEGLSVWGTALGNWGSMQGGALAQGYDRDLKGFLAGFDAGFGGHWRAGLATGYGTTELRAGNATHKADSYHAGGYLAGSYGIASIQLGAAYAWNDVHAQRRVAFGSLTQGLSDRYRADTAQVFGEVAVKGDLSGVTVQPFAGLAWVRLQGSDIAEQGGVAALHGGQRDQSMTYGSFGLRTSTALGIGGGTLRFKGSAALRHAFGDTVPVIDLGFATGPDFVTAGNALDRDSAVADAGLELDLGKHVMLGISYAGSYGTRTTDHGARAALSWRF